MTHRSAFKPRYLVFTPLVILLLLVLACGEDATPQTIIQTVVVTEEVPVTVMSPGEVITVEVPVDVPGEVMEVTVEVPVTGGQ